MFHRFRCMTSIERSLANGNCGTKNHDGDELILKGQLQDCWKSINTDNDYVHGETSSENPDTPLSNETFQPTPYLVKSNSHQSSFSRVTSSTGALDHQVKQPLRHVNSEILFNLSSEAVCHLKNRATEQWQQQQILEAIRHLKPLIRRRLQQQLRMKNVQFPNNARDIQIKSGRVVTPPSVATGRLNPRLIPKTMLRASFSPTPNLAVDHAASNARLSIGTDFEADACSSSAADLFGAPANVSPETHWKRPILTEEQMGFLTESPTGVNESLLSFSDEQELFVNEPPFYPPPTPSNLYRLEQYNPLFSRETSHGLLEEGALATRALGDKGLDAAVNVKDVNDAESLKTNVELELIQNENDHEHDKLDENGIQSHLFHSPCESKLKAGHERDAVADDTGKIDHLPPKDDQMFHGNSLPGGAISPRNLEEVIRILESVFIDQDTEEDEDISSQCKPTNLDLVFKNQDCNESFMSEITFTSDTTEEEAGILFRIHECVSIIANHFLDGLDLLCY